MKGLESLLRKKGARPALPSVFLLCVRPGTRFPCLAAIAGGGRLPAVGLRETGRTIPGFSVLAT